MAKENDKGVMFFYTWMEMLDELKPEEVVQMLEAIVDYSRNDCETEFEDRCMRVVYKSITTSIDLSRGLSDARSEAGKKGGESKPKQTEANVSKVKQTQANESKPKQTEANVSEKKRKEEKRKEEKRKEEKRKEDVEAEASTEQQPLPELTPYSASIIREVWNQSSVTLDIDDIPLFGPRADNTRLCIGQNFGKYLSVIKSLDEQYFFQQRKNAGQPITYDWFCKPDNFLKVKEGNYSKEFQRQGGYAGELGIDWDSAEQDSYQLSESP